MLASSSPSPSSQVYLNKLNLILVEILKQDWPHKWPSFIPDIVGASRTSESLCENSMHILRMLSEEVFDFSRGELTQVGVSVKYCHYMCKLFGCQPSFILLSPLISVGCQPP